jgi:hypothetical protein
MRVAIDMCIKVMYRLLLWLLCCCDTQTYFK